MKKTVLTTVVLTLLLAAGSAFAQPGPPTLPNKTHDVSVDIPPMAFIRMTSGAGVADVPDPTPVQFAWTAAAFASIGDGTYAPTNAGAFNWDDVQVRYNGDAGWRVEVSALGAEGFDWSKVAMTAAGTGVSPYDLGTDADIVSDAGKTTGWRSLGIDPANYRVTLDGTESTGTYAATVTFTLQSP